MSEQNVIQASRDYHEIDTWLKEGGFERIMLVCDSSFRFLRIRDYFTSLQERLGVGITVFDHFQPNPLYESVVEGVQIFHRDGCRAIIAVGGGSAIDVAKCIKLYSNMDHSQNYLKQTIVPNDVRLLAIPTTAGTGSEATRYAVIYYEGAKQSVTDYSCIPDTVVMDSSALLTLPAYQKKSTAMDALCHAIEAFWSVNSTEESRGYSREAIRLILANLDAYLENDPAACAEMMRAAHTAGKAINITQTTAGHAMCYKITSLFGYAHGHAAALVNRKLFPWMLSHTELCIDPRGESYLNTVFQEIAEAMDCRSPEDAAKYFDDLFQKLELAVPEASEEQFAILKKSVNPVRLGNHPIKLSEDAIDGLYHRILGIAE